MSLPEVQDLFSRGTEKSEVKRIKEQNTGTPGINSFRQTKCISNCDGISNYGFCDLRKQKGK